MRLPLFVLLSVLLEVKQRFKHGGVVKCHLCMGYFRYFGVIFWGLICLILRLIPLFSLVHLVLACFSLVADLNLSSPSVWIQE